MAKAQGRDILLPLCEATSVPARAAEEMRRRRQALLDQPAAARLQTGMYLLLADGLLPPCGKMPLRLDVCPACGHRLKPQSQWTWVSIPSLFLGENVHCSFDCSITEAIDALHDENTKSCGFADWWLEAHIGAGHSHCGGLVWLPVSRYPMPQSFIDESDGPGGVTWALRRLDERLVIGETVILVAHPDAILNRDGSVSAGICCAFIPTDVVYYSPVGEDPARVQRIRNRCIQILQPDEPPEGAR